MTSNNRTENPFTFAFKDADSGIVLELTNETDQTLTDVEVLTIFLRDEDTPGGPSQVNIKFKDTECVRPKEKVVLSHRTWVGGSPAAPGGDQLRRLEVVAGELRPYVLDISWQDAQGKSRFQRIPIGH